ncbi:MAG: hypothetical protein Q8L29_03575 [archaeon]|nr:hypothetical protein [archaeon]
MSKSMKSNHLVGSWAFLIGVVLAVAFGFLGDLSSTVSITLVVIGLVVGLLNVAHREARAFLISGAVLILASALGKDVMNLIPEVGRILDALLLIFVPATVLVAIRNVFGLAR